MVVENFEFWENPASRENIVVIPAYNTLDAKKEHEGAMFMCTRFDATIHTSTPT